MRRRLEDTDDPGGMLGRGEGGEAREQRWRAGGTLQSGGQEQVWDQAPAGYPRRQCGRTAGQAQNVSWERGSHIHVPSSRRPRRRGRITELSDTASFNGGQEKECAWSQERSAPRGREAALVWQQLRGRQVFKKEHKNSQ